MKKALSVLLIMMLLLTVVPVSGFVELGIIAYAEETYSVGDQIQFGTYPQTRVEETEELRIAAEAATWKSYNYYTGTGSASNGEMAPSSFMQFSDFFCGNEKFRAVYFSNYRPANTGAISRQENSYQYNNSYYPNKTYYFKYEPLSWRILDPKKGFIMCEELIDSQAFQNTVYYNSNTKKYYQSVETSCYANDYATSSIRTWLNYDFYETAFTPDQKNNIQTQDLVTNGYINAYNSDNRKDKVFLLSFSDALNTTYGFNSSYSTKNAARRAIGTDYAKCQGLEVADYNSSYPGTSFWWLRTPGYYSQGACDVFTDGELGIGTGFVVNGTFEGVRPACNLFELKSDDTFSNNLYSEVSGENDDPTTQCGYNVFWRIDGETGSLIVSGCGDMWNYNNANRYVSPFYDSSSIKKVIIEDGVTSIGAGAFQGCQNLESITFSESIREIADSSLSGCSILESVEIPNSLMRIGNKAFYKCNALKRVLISDLSVWICISGINQLMDYGEDHKSIYLNGKLLKDVVIPTDKETINASLFKGCVNISSVRLSDSITRIGGYACGPGNNYYSLILCNKGSYAATWAENNGVPYGLLDGTDEENTISETVNAKLSYTIDRRTRTMIIHCDGRMTEFSSYTAPWKQHQKYIENVVINEGCTSVSTLAFSQCYNLKSITLPSTIETIGERAFQDCYVLQDITIPDNVTSIGFFAFSGCRELNRVVIPDGMTEIKNSTFYGCESLVEVSIPSSVVNIDTMSFAGCSSLKKVTIPDSVTSIGDYAFSGCWALTNIEIGASVKRIKEYAFTGCTALESVSIPDSVIEIGSQAFSGCSTLKTVTFNEAKASVGNYAFYNCPMLHTLSFGNGVISIGTNAFLNCGIEALTIPSSIKTIGKEAFRNCTALETLTLEEGIQSIGANAFTGCTSLEGAVIPDSVTALSPSYTTSVDYGVFKDCTSLQSAVVGNGVTYLPAGMFSGCTSLESVQLGDNITTIYPSAFSGCSSLPTVVFGNKVKAIQENAFSGCSSLWAVDLPASVTNLGSRTFSDSSLQNITIRAMNCTIPNDAINIRTTIHGYEGSSAQTFADTYGYPFELITDTPIHDHTAGITAQKDRKPATCEAAGSYDLVTYCSYCGSEMSRETIVEGTALGHSFGAWYDAVAATCTDAGKQRRDCIRCEKYETRVLTASGHSFGDWAVASNPTCTEDGVESRMCTKCDETETKPIAALGHIEKVYSKAASCKEAGYNITVCMRCGDTLSSETFPLQEHTWDDGIATQESTCTAQGMMIYTCQVCGAEKTEPTDLRAHQWDNGVVTKNPSCSEAGEMTYTCQIGGETRTELIDKLEHEIVLVEGTVPTCTETGLTDGWQCKTCGKVFAAQKTIPATGNHTGGIATCVNKAVCDVCGQEYGEYDINNHPEDRIAAIQTVVEATCTHPGSTSGRYCTACYTIIERIVPIPAIGHSDKDNNGFCDICGTNLGTSGECNHIFNIKDASAEYLKAAATCCSDAVYYFRCEKCGASAKGIDENKTFLYGGKNPDKHPADQISVTKEAKDPTCISYGWTAEITCLACGKVLEGSTSIPSNPDGHKAADGSVADCIHQITCIYCGNVIAKDANNHPTDQVFVIKSGRAPTCGENGVKDILYCNACKRTIQYDDVIPATGMHKQAIAATCCKKAICSICGKEYGEVNPSNHDLVRVAAMAPTCTEEGSLEHWKCRECGKQFADAQGLQEITNSSALVVVADPDKHRNLQYFEKRPATCIEEGNTVYWYCDACGKYYNDRAATQQISQAYTVIAKLPHTWTEWRYSADFDCAKGGEMTRSCTVCNSKEVSMLAPQAHDYVAETTKEATCSVDGEEVYTCSFCGDSYNKPIPATGDHVDEGNDGYCDACSQQMTGGDHCKYCGQIHGGAFGWLTKLFHSIFALFKR